VLVINHHATKTSCLLFPPIIPASIPPIPNPPSQYTHASSHSFRFCIHRLFISPASNPHHNSSRMLHHLIPSTSHFLSSLPPSLYPILYLAFRSPSFPANRVVTSNATNSWGIMIHNAKPVRKFLSSKVVLPHRVNRPVEIASPDMHRATLPMVLWILLVQLKLTL